MIGLWSWIPNGFKDTGFSEILKFAIYEWPRLSPTNKNWWLWGKIDYPSCSQNLGASKHTGGCPNILGHPNIWEHPNIQGASKHIRASKHTGGHPNIWGVQTYGGIQTYRGHPNIWGLPKTQGASKHMGCPNIWGHANIQGAYVHRGAYGNPLSLTTPMPASKVGKCLWYNKINTLLKLSEHLGVWFELESHQFYLGLCNFIFDPWKNWNIQDGVPHLCLPDLSSDSE